MLNYLLDEVAVHAAVPVKLLQVALLGIPLYLIIFRGLKHKKAGSFGIGILLLIGYTMVFPHP